MVLFFGQKLVDEKTVRYKFLKIELCVASKKRTVCSLKF
jgi:hypothetical protein